ncbi:MAG: 3-dehydroquinate synthase, partial [Planctomycetota bacterium]
LVRLPTTTLGQADSGVGVKNAINYFSKKNWLGTFAVPWAVINDASLLQSLPARAFRCGFSEAVKVSLLKSAEDFHWLCENATAIANRQMDIACDAIHRSCVWHLRHITAGGDPFEALEARPLDFGHWSAHRLEAMTRYEVPHGEAVAIGVALDCLYSVEKFGFGDAAAMAVLQCMRDLQLPLWHSGMQRFDQLMSGLEEFRQHLGGRLTITMLRDVGSPIDVHEIDSGAMADAARRLEAYANS